MIISSARALLCSLVFLNACTPASTLKPERKVSTPESSEVEFRRTAPTKRVYDGQLDEMGRATIRAPQIMLANLPLIGGYIRDDRHEELFKPGLKTTSPEIPHDGRLLLNLGSHWAGLDYFAVVADIETRRTHRGNLDANGEVKHEWDSDSFPVIAAYILDRRFDPPTFRRTNNRLVGTNTIEVSAGPINARAEYIIVESAPTSLEVYEGWLDGVGRATVSANIDVRSRLPVLLGFIEDGTDSFQTAIVTIHETELFLSGGLSGADARYRIQVVHD